MNKRKQFLLKAAAIGSGSILAACSSGPVVGLPVEDAGTTGDAAGDATSGDAGTVVHDAGVVIDAGSMPVDGGGDSGPIVGTAPQDAGTDSGPIHGIIVHDAGIAIGTSPLDGG